MDSDALSPKRQRLLLAAVISGLLLAMLDQTIVGTALPSIVRHLDGSGLYLWVVTAYLVMATVSIPVYARLSDRYGRRALLLTGMSLFLLGSALSAGAQSMGQLVAFRARIPGSPGPWLPFRATSGAVSPVSVSPPYSSRPRSRRTRPRAPGTPRR